MKAYSKNWITLALLCTNLLLSQGFKIETDQGTQYVTDERVCNGRHWTEAEGKAKLEGFSDLWDTRPIVGKKSTSHQRKPLNWNAMG